MASENTDANNWLREVVIECPNCHQQLWRIDHHPMYDDWLLYCERCANRVEVSYYDPFLMEQTRNSQIQDTSGFRTEMDFIEEHLRPCSCGGHFRANAPRRCPYCLAEVITGAYSVDLWPVYYRVEEDEVDHLTDEQNAIVEQFENEHIRRDDLWK